MIIGGEPLHTYSRPLALSGANEFFGRSLLNPFFPGLLPVQRDTARRSLVAGQLLKAVPDPLDLQLIELADQGDLPLLLRKDS